MFRRKSQPILPPEPVKLPQPVDAQRLLVSPELSAIERLPAETYVNLLDQMPPTSAVLLSLTCKTFWSRVRLTKSDILHDVRRRSSLDDTNEFLTLLEKDNPSYVMCTICPTLHDRFNKRITREVTWLTRDSRFATVPRKCAEAAGLLSVGGSEKLYSEIPEFVFQRELFELVLRAATNGPQYGLAINELKRALHWEAFSCCRLRVNLDTEAALIHRDESLYLFLKGTYTVDIDLRRPLQEQVKSSGVRGCTHDLTYVRARIESVLIAVDYERGEDERQLRFVVRCASCPSDIVIDALKPRGEYFAHLNVSTYRDLGPRAVHGGDQYRRQVGAVKERFDRNEYVFGNESLEGMYRTAAGDASLNED